MITFVIEFHFGLFMEIEENGLTMASRESNEKEEEEERAGKESVFGLSTERDKRE
jgi:hypothetical protein